MASAAGKLSIVHGLAAACAVSLLVAWSSACAKPVANSGRQNTTLHIGVGPLPSLRPEDGYRQLVQNLSIESLVRFGEDGRAQPWLAERWRMSTDGLSMIFDLKNGVKYHDGSPMVAPALVPALDGSVRAFLGPAADDLDQITAPNDVQLAVRFKRPPLWSLEALEAKVIKPGSSDIGTGPYVPDRTGSTTILRANSAYYLGAAAIDRIEVRPFPTVRAAWSEMLRGQIDMLYEVGIDALASMEGSTNIAVFTFARRYQHVIMLNPHGGVLKPAAVRRALNAAIDRRALLTEAMGGRGLASSGPIWPRHWAFTAELPKLEFDPQRAVATANTGIRFTCLVAPEALNERIALFVKQQLAAAGIEMAITEASPDQILKSLASQQFDAALIEAISGPTLFRPYQFWHTRGSLNFGGFGNARLDGALDRIRHASSEDLYRAGVSAFQTAMVEDPQAIFLAWSERARAISKRFVVPAAEPGRDVLSTLRLWRPAPDERRASRN